MMKKNLYLLLTVVLMAGLFAVPLKAQNGGDGFFSDYQTDARSGGTQDSHTVEGIAYAQPLVNTTVPLGSGLLILVAGGLGYALLNNNRKED